MALECGRNTVEQGTNIVNLPVKANTKIYDGSIVCVDGGYAVPGKSAEGLVAVGRAEEYVDNTGTGGTNGAQYIKVKRGTGFLFDNDSESPVTLANVMGNCYILDECTVTSSDVGNSIAGKVIAVYEDQVLVEFR